MKVTHKGALLRYDLGVISTTAVDSARKRYLAEPIVPTETFDEFFQDGDQEVFVTYCIGSFLMDRDNTGAHGIMLKAIRDVYDDLAAAIGQSF